MECIRIRVTIQPKQIDLDVGGIAVDEFAAVIQCESGSVGVLIGIEENVGAVILVVTFEMKILAIENAAPSWQDLLSCTSIRLESKNIGSCTLRDIERHIDEKNDECVVTFMHGYKIVAFPNPRAAIVGFASGRLHVTKST